MPLLAGVNLPRIDTPTFVGSMCTGSRFGNGSKPPCIHDKPRLGEVDKLAYLQNALKEVRDSRSRAELRRRQKVIRTIGAIESLKDRYDRPRGAHLEHVRSILQAPIVKANNGMQRAVYISCMTNASNTLEQTSYQICHHLDLDIRFSPPCWN